MILGLFEFLKKIPTGGGGFLKGKRIHIPNKQWNQKYVYTEHYESE